MISETEIRRHCDPRTMQRALRIAASDRDVLTKRCRFDEYETSLNAFVVSSSGWSDCYRTNVVIDEHEGTILDHSCTCPAHLQFDGLCKHCAALALAYLDAPEKFMGYRDHRNPTTSPSLAELMKRSDKALDAEDLGVIDLETILAYGYENWSAHFRVVGPHGSYSMKSIAEFVERMRTGEHYAYGKKLAFEHTSGMLTASGRRIARFLERAVELREFSGPGMSWRSRTYDAVGRDLDLSGFEVVELLDMLADRTFTVEGSDYRTRAITHAHVIDEDPLIGIGIDRTETGGFCIVPQDDIVLAGDSERLYVWQDDVFYRCSPEFARCADFLKTVFESEDDRLFISDKDMPLFCATVLPTVEGRLGMTVPAEVDAYRPVPCELEFYFDKTSTGVTCDVWAVYGTRRFNLFDPEPDAEETEGPAPLRNERKEAKATSLIARYFRGSMPFIRLDDDETIGQLIFGGILDFQAVGSVFTTPEFDRLTSDRKPRITLGVSLAGNLINLDVSAEDLPARELGALLASYRKKKRFHRLRNGAFLDIAGFNLAQLDKIVSDLGITSHELASGTVELPSFRAFYLDEEFDETCKDGEFMRYVENLRDVDERAYQVPASLVGTLRPYQEDGFRWLNVLCDRGFGGILADEMGLGKSAQLISLLLARREEARGIGPSLIVCPASLVYNWIAEFERFAPELVVRAVAGTKRERELIRDEEGCDVFITSYDLLRIDVDDYAEREFFCHVLDEAQYIKNHATLTTRSVKRVRSVHRFALTGTPMENRLSELWSIFDFLMPGLLGTYMRFRERFELAILGGDEDTAHRLQSLVGPFILRRLKSDVLRELPEKLESVVYAQLEGEQRQLYVAHEQNLRISLEEQKSRKFDEKKVEVLAELTKLRQICCDPHLLYENYAGPSAKLDTIMELVGNGIDSGAKMLVFSQFTSFLTLISDRLEQSGIPYYTITGATPKKKRLDLVNAFNEDETPVFLVSLKAGGTGLNLTGASIVIHADPWWNAAAQEQATDRAHRIGQKSVVTVYRVIATETIEERIVRLQDMKSDLAAQVIGHAGISLAGMTKDDLLALLEP